MAKQTLGQLLFKSRNKLNFSLRKSAELVGLSANTIFKLENDTVENPSIHVFVLLSDAYEIDLNKLVRAWQNGHDEREYNADRRY